MKNRKHKVMMNLKTGEELGKIWLWLAIHDKHCENIASNTKSPTGNSSRGIIQSKVSQVKQNANLICNYSEQSTTRAT
jgi:hypothetical protein